MTPSSRRKPALFLAGDPLLVAEFGALCESRGVAAIAAPERGTGRPPRTAAAAVELTLAGADAKRKRLAALDTALPAATPILTASATVTAAEQSGWIRRPARLVGIGAFPTLLGGELMEVAAAPATSDGTLVRTREILGLLGKEMSVVQDRVGLVMPRILCMLINEAFHALTEGVAAPPDIDTAMKLGTNHPRGPVEWANLAGIGIVAAVLDALRASTGEERYRLAPLLQQVSHEPGLRTN